jgi:hypothetical protein
MREYERACVHAIWEDRLRDRVTIIGEKSLIEKKKQNAHVHREHRSRKEKVNVKYGKSKKKNKKYFDIKFSRYT